MSLTVKTSWQAVYFLIHIRRVIAVHILSSPNMNYVKIRDVKIMESTVNRTVYNYSINSLSLLKRVKSVVIAIMIHPQINL